MTGEYDCWSVKRVKQTNHFLILVNILLGVKRDIENHVNRVELKKLYLSITLIQK